jgi:hypothetical protein
MEQRTWFAAPLFFNKFLTLYRTFPANVLSHTVLPFATVPK